MKKLFGVVILLLIAVIMALTVPDKEAHKAAMMKVVEELVDEEAANHGFGTNILSRLGKNVITQTIAATLENKLEVDNYIVLNTTHATLQGEDQLLSVGVLGHVFTFDKEQLRKKLKEAF